MRHVRIALIQRVSTFGTVEGPQQLFSDKEFRYLMAILSGKAPKPIPKPADPLAAMPHEVRDRSVEAIRRSLPQLIKLDRYERRAVLRRDRTLRQMLKRSITINNNLKLK
jgi:hypothetical protein